MKRITAATALSAAACAALSTAVTAPADATVVSRVSLSSPMSFSNFTVGCPYEARVRVNDGSNTIRLVEGRAGSRSARVVARTVPAADKGIFIWRPKEPGRRVLRAVQTTRGRSIYSAPIVVTVSPGILGCFSV
ncbi:MAG: hypothetical protein QM728_13805 [Gordonia sp. (in: high G+C Gram-positive bacteria)]|uniref:hypothetical protein n=1 Tax=Gordonia sp. (in: high G+C Gram-positive bacteria) TaxID=84139 RepID=UPI0039E36095